MSSWSPRRRRRPPLNWPQMRPRFDLAVACSADAVMISLREGVRDTTRGVEGRFSERHGTLTIPEDERQFFSPQLGLTLEEGNERVEGRASTRVLGIFQPDPEIWTAFVFALGTLMGIGICGLVYGIVQLSMGWPPWALILPLVALLMGGLVYTSTLVGQGLGAAEMHRLRSCLDDCLADARRRAAREPKTSRESASL